MAYFVANAAFLLPVPAATHGKQPPVGAGAWGGGGGVLIAGLIIKLLVTLAHFSRRQLPGRRLVVVHIDCRYRERPQLFHRLHRHPEAVGGPH